MAQVQEERCSTKVTEIKKKRELEALCLRIEVAFQRLKDDVQRLEQEHSQLKKSAKLVKTQDPSDAFVILDNRGDTDRACHICLKEEVSVVFLPCAHQLVCAKCGEDYGKRKELVPVASVPLKR